MSLISALALAAAATSAVAQGQAAKNEAEYGGKVRLADGKAEELAIGAEAERLADTQREVKAQQRVTAATSGGGLSSGQNIMVLAEQAQRMQMDQLELQRQQDIAHSGAKAEASLLQMRGKNAQTSGYFNAISSGVGAYSSSGGTFGKSSSSSSPSGMTLKSDAPASVRAKYGW